MRSEFTAQEHLMFRATDVHSLTDFQRSTREHILRLRETGRPALLTVNGRAEVVVQEAEAYQALLDRLDRAEAIAGIHRGLVSMRRGEGVSAEEGLEALRTELGIGARVG
jgi:PHD/YefM family antitoxin component YafN of YafNO toxin-antitoxin module